MRLIDVDVAAAVVVVGVVAAAVVEVRNVKDEEMNHMDVDGVEVVPCLHLIVAAVVAVVIFVV